MGKIGELNSSWNNFIELIYEMLELVFDIEIYLLCFDARETINECELLRIKRYLIFIIAARTNSPKIYWKYCHSSNQRVFPRFSRENKRNSKNSTEKGGTFHFWKEKKSSLALLRKLPIKAFYFLDWLAILPTNWIEYILRSQKRRRRTLRVNSIKLQFQYH